MATSIEPAKPKRLPKRISLTLAVGLVLGLVGSLINPFANAPDELSHLIRVIEVDHGYFVAPQTQPDAVQPVLDGCLVGYLGTRYLQRGATDGSLTDQFKAYPCTDDRPIEMGAADQSANAEVNPPLPYLPSWAGYRIGRAVGGTPWNIFGARIAPLITYLVLVVVALRTLPFGRTFLTAVALMPAGLQIAGAISADPVSNGIAFVFVALIVRTIDDAHHGVRANGRRLIVLGGTALAVSMTKPSSLALLLLLVAIPTAAFGSLARRCKLIALCASPAIVFGLVWLMGVTAQTRISMGPRADSLASAELYRQRPWDFAQAVWRGATDVGATGKALAQFVTTVNIHPITSWVTILTVVLLVTLALARFVDPPMRRIAGVDKMQYAGSGGRLVPVTVTVATVWIGLWVIAYGVALASNPVGATKITDYQGRYLIPYLAATLVGASLVPVAEHRERIVRNLQRTALILILAVNVWWIVDRFTMFY